MAKSKIVLYLYFFVFLFGVNYVFGQDAQNITGRVVDADTGEPLKFAHVYVGSTGTVTNQAGYFNLAVSEIGEKDILSVSFIGYHSAGIVLSKLDRLQDISVVLESVPIELPMVSVNSGRTILRQIISRIDINYEFAHQSAVCFFRESLSTQLSKKYVAEGIFDIYLPNNFSNSDIQVAVIRSRKETYDGEFDGEHILIKGHAVDMVQSVVWRDDSFLNKNKRNNYEFSYDGVTEYNDGDVFIINFEPANRRGKYSGTMYVDYDTYAIIKIEYFPDTSRSNFWESAKWVEEFDNRNGSWFLSRVSYSGEWYEYDQLFNFESLLVVNIVETVKDVPAMGVLLRKRETFFEEAEGDIYNEDFWRGFSFVKQQLTDNY